MTELIGLATELGLVTPRDPVRLKPGLGGAELWRLESDDGPRVLRLFAAGAPPVLAEREAAAHTWARAHGVPAPEITACRVIEGRPAIAMSWADGPLLSEQLQQPDGQPAELGRRCGELLARLHRPIDSVPPAISERHWLDWAGDLAAELSPLLAALLADRDPGEQRVLHLDFHPENLVVGERLVVLDWANVRVGPPAADLARTLSIIELVQQAVPHLPPTAAAVLDEYRSGLLDGYAAAGGDPEVPALFMAWAYAVQLHDLAGSWVPAWYLDELSRRYRAIVDQFV